MRAIETHLFPGGDRASGEGLGCGTPIQWPVWLRVSDQGPWAQGGAGGHNKKGG
jgi:hypothetical protein